MVGLKNGQMIKRKLPENLKIRKTKMKRFSLTITPAVPIELRHKISDLIEQEGYDVWAQGQFVDKSKCDINFDEVEKVNHAKKNSDT